MTKSLICNNIISLQFKLATYITFIVGWWRTGRNYIQYTRKVKSTSAILSTPSNYKTRKIDPILCNVYWNQIIYELKYYSFYLEMNTLWYTYNIRKLLLFIDICRFYFFIYWNRDIDHLNVLTIIW